MKSQKQIFISAFLCIFSVMLSLSIICSCTASSRETSEAEDAYGAASSHSDSTALTTATEASLATSADTDGQGDLTTDLITDLTTDHITTEPPVTDSPEPVYVYSGAVNDFLLPEEEFSWERKYAPEFVMIHFTSAVVNHRSDPYNMEYIRQTFIDYDVSVHYIVERDGTVVCYVPENRVAWHAGKGEFGDPKYTNSMNHYSIGIEVVGIGSEADMSIYLTSREYRALDDSLKGFTDEQYASLALLIDDICQRYSIKKDRDHVIGHEEYSPRKNDPGELFDWSRVIG